MNKKNGRKIDKNASRESVCFEMAKYLWNVKLHGEPQNKQHMFLQLTAECSRALIGDYKRPKNNKRK